MPSVPMVPAHEREHIEQASAALEERQKPALLERWARAMASVEAARVYDAYLELNEILKLGTLDATERTYVQLLAVYCLRDAPVERVKTELAFIEPQDAYQTLVLDYRLGWLMRHRLKAPAAADQYFDRVREEARRLGARAWEIAALLQQADALAEEERAEEADEAYSRVYNLSRRNGYVEYIPKSLLGKGSLLLAQGQRAEGEEHLQKAYELACRNKLVAEQGLVLYALGRAYHRHFNFYGLALEYYEQARLTLKHVPVWNSLIEALERDHHACQTDLEELDIAKILGPVPITKLRQDYLTSLVNGFVGIPGIDNRTQLGERIGLTRQAIHRNING